MSVAKRQIEEQLNTVQEDGIHTDYEALYKQEAAKNQKLNCALMNMIVVYDGLRSAHDNREELSKPCLDLYNEYYQRAKRAQCYTNHPELNPKYLLAPGC